MDQDSEVAKFKWILIAGIVFLMTGYYSMQEFRYLAFGKSAEATVTQLREKTVSGRYGRTHLELVIEYQFTDSGSGVRNERDSVAIDWPRPANGKCEIQYIPGVEKTSRLLGHSHFFAVYLFLACFAGLAFAIYKVSRLVNEPPQRYGTRRGK